MSSGQVIGNIAVIVVLTLIVFVVISLVRAVRIVPQSQAYVVERLGRYQAVLEGGFHLLVPFVDRVAARIDLREQVANFPPQPVITADQAMVVDRLRDLLPDHRSAQRDLRGRELPAGDRAAHRDHAA